MIIFYDEKSNDSSITAATEIVNYPSTNVIDSRLSRIYKTDSSTTLEIVFNMGSAVDVDSVCIAKHNFTSSATIKLQGNATNVWTAPSVDETLTYDEDIILEVIVPQTYQYWRVQVVDATNPDGFLSVGRIWIGESYDTPGVGTSLKVEYNSTATKSRTISGQTLLDRNYRYKNVSVQHPAILHTDKAEFETILDTVDIGIPFFVLFDESCSDLDAMYATLDETGFTFTVLSNVDYYTTSYKLIEEK